MSARSSRQLYDELDPLYRAIWGTSLHHGFWDDPRLSAEQARQKLVELVFEKLRPRGTIVDVGCGYGTLARQLIERFDCRVIANTDSKEQAARAPSHSSLTITTGNWLDQNPAPCSFDAALALESLSHFPSFREFFRHLHPALKPEATVVVADWFSDQGGRPLLRHLASAGGLPAWRSLASLKEAAQEEGFHLAGSSELSRGVSPTWSRLFVRALALPFENPSQLPRLLKHAGKHPALLWTFPLLRLLYQTGDLEYHLVSFRK